MLRFTRFLAITVTTAGLAMFVGCNGGGDDVTTTDTPPPAGEASDESATPDEHADPHDIPPTEEEIQTLRDKVSTYDAAVQQIQDYRDTIREETTAGEPAKAHRSLDMLDYVLQWLPEIAQDSNVPREQWETIGENAQTLRDLFNEVHARIDAGEDPDYAAVGDQVEQAIDELAAIDTSAAAEEESAN